MLQPYKTSVMIQQAKCNVSICRLFHTEKARKRIIINFLFKYAFHNPRILQTVFEV